MTTGLTLGVLIVTLISGIFNAFSKKSNKITLTIHGLLALASTIAVILIIKN